MFDHVVGTRFGDEGRVKFWIFASEIELTNDCGGRNVFAFGRGGIFPGLGKIEGKSKSRGG